MKPVLLDLFCGAGGAARGYQEAGFYVVGVDHKPQPNYCGDHFVQAEACEFLEGMVAGRARGEMVGSWSPVAIHASPPCQAHTSMRHLGKGAGEGRPELIPAVRELLQATGLPYVLENVVGAPLINPMRLCGSSFGLNVWRHRLFECSFPMLVPTCQHYVAPEPIGVYGDHPQSSKERGTYRVRRARTLQEGQEAMGIDWMEWKSLTQAIPPAMTRHIGEYLLAQVEADAKAAA